MTETERQGDRERDMDMKENYQLVASHTHLTGDRTRNLLVYETTLQPTNHPAKASSKLFYHLAHFFFLGKAASLSRSTYTDWDQNLKEKKLMRTQKTPS